MSCEICCLQSLIHSFYVVCMLCRCCCLFFFKSCSFQVMITYIYTNSCATFIYKQKKIWVTLLMFHHNQKSNGMAKISMWIHTNIGVLHCVCCVLSQLNLRCIWFFFLVFIFATLYTRHIDAWVLYLFLLHLTVFRSPDSYKFLY